MDVKGRRLFLSKRAQPFPRATSTLQLGIGRDDVDQVDLVLEGLDGALFNAWQLWAESCFLKASVNVLSESAQTSSQLAKSRYCVLSFRDERMIGCDVDEADIKVARCGAVLRDKLVASGD